MNCRLGVALIVCAPLLCAVAWAESCTVRMTRPGNAYFADETVQMTLSLPAPRREVSAVVTDYHGAKRWTGSVSVGGAQPVALVIGPPLGVGYYELSLRWDAGTQRETFCVLPRPYEDPGDPGIFGLCPGNGSTDEILQTAAQIGVRVVRQTVAWPPLEPRRGVWNTPLLQEWYDMAARHGMQMMLVLGYTPSFVAEKPRNTLDDWWANNAVFTWHPNDVTEYWRYIARVTAFAQNRTVRWPATETTTVGMSGLATHRPAQQSLPWAQSWEMWNEADICFYMGDWNRYMDLLRMSWAAGRQRLPHTPMVYGGSTGNFTAMGMIASGSPRYCFDYIALHTGGDVEEALRVWYSGAQQIPWCVGQPRETSHTECYAQGRRGTVGFTTYHETPAELQRCYLTLKAWREAQFFRSGCLGGLIGTKDDYAPGTAMLWSEDGKLSPTPLYPAFAAARKLLSDAVEVGPLDLGDKVTAHLFLKHGEPLLAAWSDDGATVEVQVGREARQIDPFGTETPLGGPTTIARTLGPEPFVVLGADGTRYLPEALRRRFDLLTGTPYGTTQTNPACWVWYAHPLQQDLQDVLGTSAYTRLNWAVRQAERALASDPAQAPSALLSATYVCWQTSMALLATCQTGQEIPVKVANNLWRLARIDEWLGEVADEVSMTGGGLPLSAAQVAGMNDRVQQVSALVASRHGAAQAPVADHLMNRCRWQLERLNRVQRQGTYNAIMHKTKTASAASQIERGIVLRVVPVVDFTTGQPFRKARMLEPGQTHTLTLTVFNYLDRQVSGTVELRFPAGWSPRRKTIPFSAGPGKGSIPRPITVTLADSPTPWVQAATFTLDGLLNVTLPSSLADNPLLEVDGKLSTGEPLATMAYFLNIGHWLDGESAATTQALRSASAAPATDATAPQLPAGVKAMQVRSVMQEMARLTQQHPRDGRLVQSPDEP